MATWVVYDVTAAAATLPPSLAAAFDAWLTAEDRMTRLALVVTGVVEDFRKATLADADAAGSLDAAQIPLSCLRHANAIAWYILAFELGSDTDAYRAAWQDAEIYLRRLYMDSKTAASTAGAAGTPRYSGSRSTAARVATGLAGPADSALTVTKGTATETEQMLIARLDGMAKRAASLGVIGEVFDADALRARANDLASTVASV